MANRARLVTLLKKLVSIDSQNPPGNERRIADFVAEFFRHLGVPVRTYEFAKNRTNVVATLAGKDRRRSLLVTPHLDTVPAGRSWTVPPFSGRVAGDRLYGLGATDCKGNLAAGMEAIRSLVEQGAALGYTLVFAATADEESGSRLGLEPLLDRRILAPDAALVLDSDDFSIIVTQKGLLHLKVQVPGKRAHGAYPWQGRSAIDASLGFLAELKEHAFVYRKNKYLHQPTLNIGTIRGGDKVNVVADWCECELDFRFLPGQSSAAILREIKAIIRRHAPGSRLQIDGIQEPYRISRSHPLVEGLVRAMRACRMRPALKGSEGATTLSFFQEKKIPAVATGFGVERCAHVADEYATIRALCRGAEVVERFLRSFSFASFT